MLRSGLSYAGLRVPLRLVPPAVEQTVSYVRRGRDAGLPTVWGGAGADDKAHLTRRGDEERRVASGGAGGSEYVRRRGRKRPAQRGALGEDAGRGAGGRRPGRPRAGGGGA